MSINSLSQTLLNGELEGPANVSTAPDDWEMIPFSDPSCEAEDEPGATPDIYTIDGPAEPYGVYGNPKEGNSFVSGIHSSSHHEGIQQTVAGFEIGGVYKVSFWQAVVKQWLGSGLADTSGGWAMYVDNTLIGVSISSRNLTPAPIGLDLIWEQRSLSFEATSNTHVIKFLPTDDDPDQTTGSENLSGGLKMGLDHLTLVKVASAGINGADSTSEPLLIGIYDTFGRKVTNKPNALLIHVYDDGTIKKVFRIE